MVAAQAANWYEAPRRARNGAAMAVQYGGRYGERATQKQSREEEAEGGQEQEESRAGGLAVHPGADDGERRQRQEILVTA